MTQGGGGSPNTQAKRNGLCNLLFVCLHPNFHILLLGELDRPRHAPGTSMPTKSYDVLAQGHTQESSRTYTDAFRYNKKGCKTNTHGAVWARW